eukprot:jgi/Mesvir1/20276/Mv13509-RA.1
MITPSRCPSSPRRRDACHRVLQILVAMACVAGLLCALPPQGHPSDSPSSEPAQRLFPSDAHRPCPCVVDGKSQQELATANAALNGLSALRLVLLSPADAKGHQVCRDLFNGFPLSWKNDDGADASKANMTTSSQLAAEDDPRQGGGRPPIPRQTTDSSQVDRSQNGSAHDDPSTRAKELFGELSSSCKDTCAVVGGSSRLRGAGHGPEIDRADLVIRINSAPVRGYDADVGARTSLRVVFPASLVMLRRKVHSKNIQIVETEPDLYLLRCDMVRCKRVLSHMPLSIPPELRVRHKALPQHEMMEAVNRTVLLNLHAFYPLLHAVSARKASSGALSIMLALMLCRRVSLYGFGNGSNNTYTYYYEKQAAEPARLEWAVVNATHVPRRVRHHDIYSEWRAWEALSDAGLVRLVH